MSKDTAASAAEQNEFSLVPEEFHFTLRDANGTRHAYVLREANGEVRDKYLDNLAGRTRYDDEGRPVGVRSFGGMQAALLVGCVMHMPEGNVHEEWPVTLEEVQAWPARTQKALFEKAQKLSGLDDKAADTAKK